MAVAARASQVGGDGPVRVTVMSDGQAIADTIEVIQIQVCHAIGTIPTAQIVLTDGDMASGAWPVADASTFMPGTTISIKAGYGSDEEVIFEGIVVKLGTRIDGNNMSRLNVSCQDRAVKMTLGRNSANHIDKSDADIINSLIDAHGLVPDVDATTPVFRELVQYYCSDWDFMMSRAEANALMVIVDSGKISVKAPTIDASPILELSWGVDLMDFEAEMDARSQIGTVHATAWDPKSQAIVQSSATSLSLNAQGNLDSSALADALDRTEIGLRSATMIDADALAVWAKAQQVKAGLARIRGQMKFQGTARAKVGDLIKLSGVGARYDGDVFVGRLTHQIADGNWTTEAEFGLPANWFTERPDVIAPPASGWLPGAAGLQVGIVMKLDGDPAGEHRVQVDIPVLQTETKGVWARLLQSHASQEFGAFHVPEIGDEVVIGYFNDDPSNPIILGSLYSSNRPPPYALEAENHIKAIVTRSKARIEIDDKDVTVTVRTPAENMVVISDKDQSILLQDQHGNSVKLDANGIRFDSNRDIVMSAAGSISAKAGQGIALSASGDLTARGLNVTAEAQAAFVGKGAASAELSASGQTVVRGAVVMIN